MKKLLRWMHWLNSRNQWDWQEIIIDILLLGILITIVTFTLIIKGME